MSDQTLISEPGTNKPVISEPVISEPVNGRRQELAGFLRSRRERIAPEQVGLPPASRRRTPGLRREEVATLAGVGVTWYTWLEQGRDINASPQVLDAIARTLLLDPHERDHLFRLADAPDNNGQSECKTLPPTAQLLLDQLEPFPACIRNARFDVLAFNQAYEDLMGPLMTCRSRSGIRCGASSPTPPAGPPCSTGRKARAGLVAEYRAAMAEHLAEPAWKCLVSRLTKASPEFAELWERHEVASPENLTKRYLHREVGLLQLNYTHLWLGQRLGTRMTTYTPANEETDAKLRDLHDRRPQLVRANRRPGLASRANAGILAATTPQPERCEGTPMTSQARWGLTLPLHGMPVAEQRDLVASLPGLGYTDAWSAELNGVDAFTPLTLASQWAPELRLGTAIVGVYGRAPVTLAVQAATLADLAPGRFVMGIGTSSKVAVEQWNGIPFEKPYQRSRDTLRFLREAWPGAR